MKNRWFSKFLAGIGAGLILICLVGNSAQAAAGDIDFLWAKQIGGSGSDEGFGITIDSDGNVYTTGYFEGTVDFDPGVGITNLTSAGGRDIFISKLDSNGNFVWAKRIGGASDDYGNRIFLDSSGNVYTTGLFGGIVDFDPGSGTNNLASNGSNDIFILKLDRNGNFVWAAAMGGTGDDGGFGIALDSNNNVYTTGVFYNTADFNPGPGVFNMTSAGGMDIFISKLDSDGNFIWAKRMGGPNDDKAIAIV
jgi:hypothetical protein